MEALFAQVKLHYPLFTARDEISLSDRALAFIVGELAPYNLADTEIDAKGAAYQELVGDNLRGDRGQYFTPVAAVKLMVDILAPQEHERVLDPACGTGGFLREPLASLLKRWREEEESWRTAGCSPASSCRWRPSFTRPGGQLTARTLRWALLGLPCAPRAFLGH